jgi:iron complex transport system substrate-binding protein
MIGAADPGIAPRRIVSLVPATTEMLYALGAADRLVGVSSYDRFPPEVRQVPRVGGLLDPDVERLLALKPDLVIVYDTQQELREQLARAGIPMFLYRHRGLPDVLTTLRALGDRVGLGERAAALAQRMNDQLEAVRARVATKHHPRTLIVFGREAGSLRNVNASGGYGFLHDLLVLAGGADVLADIPRQSVMLSTEGLLSRAPEVIVELHYGASMSAAKIEAERRVWNALPSIPAVKNGRVYLLVGDEFVVPGPRIVIAAERLAQVLHP